MKKLMFIILIVVTMPAFCIDFSYKIIGYFDDPIDYLSSDEGVEKEELADFNFFANLDDNDYISRTVRDYLESIKLIEYYEFNILIRVDVKYPNDTFMYRVYFWREDLDGSNHRVVVIPLFKY